MSKAKTGVTQRVWMFLLEHGGRWTIAELAEQVGGVSATYMDRIVWSMHDCGSVTKYRSALRKNGVAFAVLPSNRIPQGVKLRDVAAVLSVRQQIDQCSVAANDSRRRAA